MRRKAQQLLWLFWGRCVNCGALEWNYLAFAGKRVCFRCGYGSAYVTPVDQLEQETNV